MIATKIHTALSERVAARIQIVRIQRHELVSSIMRLLPNPWRHVCLSTIPAVRREILR